MSERPRDKNIFIAGTVGIKGAVCEGSPMVMKRQPSSNKPRVDLFGVSGGACLWQISCLAAAMTSCR